jgi:hypothetical protein
VAFISLAAEHRSIVPVGAIRACRSRLFGWDAIGRHCFGRTRVCADPKVTMASKSSGLNLKHMAGNLDSKCVPSGRVRRRTDPRLPVVTPTFERHALRERVAHAARA